MIWASNFTLGKFAPLFDRSTFRKAKGRMSFSQNWLNMLLIKKIWLLGSRMAGKMLVVALNLFLLLSGVAADDEAEPTCWTSGLCAVQALDRITAVTTRLKFWNERNILWWTKSVRGGRHSVCASYPAVPGLILGVPEATYLMLLRFIDSGTAEREKAY